MSKTGHSAAIEANAIHTLIIKADDTFEVRVLPQDIRIWHEVGGHVEAWSGEDCTFWFNEDGKRDELPRNVLATFLWWKLCPEIAEQAVLKGTVLITGPADEYGDSLPLDPTVVELFHQIVQIYREYGLSEAEGTE
jgi:Domain of unknown function (DUF3846)